MSNVCGTALSDPIELRVATTPIALSISAGSLVMGWLDAAATLQTATSPTSPWTAVPAPPKPYTVVPRDSRGFFRLIH